MTSVGDSTSPMGEDSRLRTWIVFDDHENSPLGPLKQFQPM